MSVLTNFYFPSDGPTYVWLGATDKNEDKVWRWFDGTNVPMGTPFLGPGQPDDSNGQDRCLTIWAPTGYFNDLHCSRDYVCVMCQDWSS